MSSAGYIAEVKNLSSKATRKEVVYFFGFCGRLLNVEMIKFGRHDYRAYITFEELHAVKIAALLTGSCIGKSKRRVQITVYGEYEACFVNLENLVKATEVVKTMAAKGFTLGKGAYQRAKQLDQSYLVSARAVNTAAFVSHKIGLTDKYREVDEKYKVSDKANIGVQMTVTALKQGALLVSSVLGFTARAADYTARAAANFGSS